MRERRALVCTAMALALSAAVGVSAQSEEEAAGPAIRPSEIYGCTFRDGQGMAQLNEVASHWNAWMDETGQGNYWAFLLVPMYRSPELPYDVLWAGGWPDGAQMASGLSRWMTEGGPLQAEFDAVVDCPGVTNFAVMDLQPVPSPFESGPVSFSNCTVEEGHTFPEALEAVNAWLAYESEKGIESDNFMLFPAFGESSDADYSFKWVTTQSFEDFGESYDNYGTGGGWQKARELFDDLLDCDSSRLYFGTRVRGMAMEQ